MIGEDVLVIDAVVHGYNFTPENLVDERGAMVSEVVYRGFHVPFSPRNDPKWTLDEDRFRRGADPEWLAHTLFAQSWTDVAVYHSIPFDMFKDGGSPAWVAHEIRERTPGRMFLYGPFAPWLDSALDDIDRLAEEDGVIGLKMYPMDLVNGEIKVGLMDDPELLFPAYERARQVGIRVIAVHKALPMGPVPSLPFKVGDIEGAAAAFPDLTFEIVHGGFAYLEETALLLRFPNVTINLEGVPAFAVNAPRKFAEIIGTFLANGGADRVLWGTGCLALHPQPQLEAFWNFEMPADMVESYGLPPLDEATKRGILGENFARIHGLDVQKLREGVADDEWAGRKKLAKPWTGPKRP